MHRCPVLTISQIKQELEEKGRDGQLKFFSSFLCDNNHTGSKINKVAFCKCEGMISNINHSRKYASFYYAAPDPSCLGKVVEIPNTNSNYVGNYKWYCAQNGQTYTSYFPRYVLRFTTESSDGRINIICFDSVAKKLIGVDATVADKHFKDGNWDAYFGLFEHLYFVNYEFVLKCKPKILRSYNSKNVQTEHVVIEYYCVDFRIINNLTPVAALLSDIKTLQLIKADLTEQNSSNKDAKKEEDVNDETMFH